MPTVYLYVPFDENEDPEELKGMAERWKKVYESKQLLREALTEDSPNPYQAKNIKIVSAGSNGLKNMKEGDKVYVLSHGMSETTKVCNKARGESVTLDQNTIASRMIADGLPENVNIKVNLYYCDESNSAQDRAVKFDSALTDPAHDKNYSKVDLNYYPGVILTTLSAPHDKEGQDDKAYKRAMRKRNLKELDPTELNLQFTALLQELSAEQLNGYLKSLTADTLLHLFHNLDMKLIEAIRSKAKIGDQATFFKSLAKEQRYEPEIYDELGKAKDFKKTFDRNEKPPATRPAAVLTQAKTPLSPSSNTALNIKSGNIVSEKSPVTKPNKPGSD